MTPEERALSMVELVDRGGGYQSMRLKGQTSVLWHSADAALMQQRQRETVAAIAGAIRAAMQECAAACDEIDAGNREDALLCADAIRAMGGTAMSNNKESPVMTPVQRAARAIWDRWDEYVEDDVVEAVAAAIREAVLEEREACAAAMCGGCRKGVPYDPDTGCHLCPDVARGCDAADIRARGGKP